MGELNRYLRVIEGDCPAGENLEYDDAYLQMEDLASNGDASLTTGEEESKSVDYKALLKVTSNLLEQTRDFRVAVFHTMALTATQGFKGLKDGLTLLGFISVELWEQAYPQLDPDDDLDPTERLNILSALSPNSVNDPFGFLKVLMRQPFCPPLPLNSREVKIAKGLINSDEDSDIGLLKGQILSLPEAKYAENYALIKCCLESAESLEQAINAQILSGNLSLEKLKNELRFILRFLNESRGVPLLLNESATSASVPASSLMVPEAGATGAAQSSGSLDDGSLATGHVASSEFVAKSDASSAKGGVAQAVSQPATGMAAQARHTGQVGPVSLAAEAGTMGVAETGAMGLAQAGAIGLAQAGAWAGTGIEAGSRDGRQVDLKSSVPLGAYLQLQQQVQQLQTQVQALKQQLAAQDLASMAIASRKDALALIEKCRTYFHKKEPNSPLPFLLQRAIRMADMDFIQLLGEIDSSALERGREQLGVKPPEDK